MKKLDEIPKKQLLEVPDGYFEKLPAIIQSRVTQQSENTSWFGSYRFVVRLAIPVVILIAVGTFWLSGPQTDVSAETILASVETEQLVAYLDESEVSTEELLENGMINAQDVTVIEESVYQFQLNDSQYEDILNDFE